ncbi:MAG: ATPase [Candidatus Latescibacterota bacterium]|jgi:putative secretion ATPase (PEP-CTERM system associated)|nr:MAG: ATPase [Candidatus Latescibacterota bacterium]
MYEEFFGFKELPFNVTPDPRFLYRSVSHRDALAYITYGVFQRKGFVAMTGEVGVGKTTVVGAFIDLFEPSLEVAFVFSTKFPFEQLLFLICKDFGLSADGLNKAQMLLLLNEFLIRQNEDNRNAVLIIDEAQNLSPEVLEELRMLSNLETRDRKLLQIMLVGQPELETLLNMNELRQLRQRIPGICRISMLNREDVENYIRYRLDVAGGRGNGVHFTSDSFDEIYHYSNGIPRLINILCDRVLLVAYVADTRVVDGRLVREGIRDLESPGVSSGRHRVAKPRA